MKFQIVAVGGLKERYLREGCEEYRKRLSAYGTVEIVELPEERTGRESGSEIARAVEREGERILAKLGPRALAVALCVEGEQMESEAFAKFLGDAQSGGRSEIAFIIGGSHGLSEAVKARAQRRLSFSKMTFPHQLMRLVLLEQLYRAGNILAGGKYHK